MPFSLHRDAIPTHWGHRVLAGRGSHQAFRGQEWRKVQPVMMKGCVHGLPTWVGPSSSYHLLMTQ